MKYLLILITIFVFGCNDNGIGGEEDKDSISNEFRYYEPSESAKDSVPLSGLDNKYTFPGERDGTKIIIDDSDTAIFFINDPHRSIVRIGDIDSLTSLNPIGNFSVKYCDDSSGCYSITQSYPDSILIIEGDTMKVIKMIWNELLNNYDWKRKCDSLILILK